MSSLPMLPMLPMFFALVSLFSSVMSSSVQAADDAQSFSPENRSSAWNHAVDMSRDWWHRSRETVAGAWDDTRDGFGQLWTGTKDAAGGAWESTRGLFEEQGDPFGELWEEVYPKLARTLTLEERHEALPQKTWFGADQESNQAVISALLDEAVEILARSGVQDYRERMRSLQREIERAREAIADYRRRRVSAPESSVVRRTVEDFDHAIEETKASIRGYKKELADVRRAFAVDLRGMGLDLSDEQIELLLTTVVGDNLIDLGIVFDNVKAITAQLGELVQDSGEDLPSARRYYGMYVVLLKCLDRMHLQVEEAIDERYIPSINSIITRAKQLVAETKALQQRSPKKAELLAANLSAQNLTIEAAVLYRDYLIDQARQVSSARRGLEQDIAAAWNTYETVRVSGELVGLVRSSRKLLEGLLDRQVPALRPFGNLEMKREFERLTVQLRQSDEP